MIQKFMGVDFLKAKVSALTGETVVTWQEQSGEAYPFEIRADRMGVHIKGIMKTVIDSNAKLQSFALLVSEAWKEAERLKPKIHTSSKDINA